MSELMNAWWSRVGGPPTVNAQHDPAATQPDQGGNPPAKLSRSAWNTVQHQFTIRRERKNPLHFIRIASAMHLLRLCTQLIRTV